MRTILVMLVLGAAAYYFYAHLQGQRDGEAPKEITNPVYLEVRYEMAVQSRQFEFVLFGKMADEKDCRQGADQAWASMTDHCDFCKKKVSTCHATLEPRYLRLFDDAPINTTYLALTRGKPSERDGRVVFWGVTTEEGNFVCDVLKKEFSKNYKGAASCVPGLAQ